MSTGETSRRRFEEQPLQRFSRCHEGIISQLGHAAELPQLLASANWARRISSDLVRMFRQAVIPHHREEEQELFSAVMRSAADGHEAVQVKGMIERLVREHRQIEAQWKLLEPGMKAAAKGAASAVDDELLDELVSAYLQHARFEEEQFLPLAKTILSRDGKHMAALGVSLHLRHKLPVIGYI